MPIIALRLTDEELVLIEALTEVTFSRSRSEMIRDAVIDLAERRADVVREMKDAVHARRYYMPRARRK